MFTTTADNRLIPFMTTTELISIPTGFMYIAAIGTMWQGRLRLRTPMLYILMSMLNFLIGGFTGVFLADVPADFQLHNTYFVVAHFHYTIIGGMVFAWLGATHYWFPKYSGRMCRRGDREARGLDHLHRLQRHLLRHVHRWCRRHEPARRHLHALSQRHKHMDVAVVVPARARLLRRIPEYPRRVGERPAGAGRSVGAARHSSGRPRRRRRTRTSTRRPS